MRRRIISESNESVTRQRHMSLTDSVWLRLRVTAAIMGLGYSELAETILKKALGRMGRVRDDGSISLVRS